MTDPMPAIRGILGMPEAKPAFETTTAPNADSFVRQPAPDYADTIAKRIAYGPGYEDARTRSLTDLIAVGVRAGYALGYGART